jgi:glucose/arabinose dehydrogenase
VRSFRDARALWAACALVIALTLGARPSQAQILVPTGFSDELLSGNLDRPVGLAFLPDGRLLMVELKTARVRMLVGGALASTDPLGTVDSVDTNEEETGLLGIAVDPRWPSKPFLYVMYTATNATIRISRFAVQGDLSDPNSGNLSIDKPSRRDLIRDVPSITSSHNSGTLRFGPDSLLYASFGEDTRGCMAIDSTTLFGVIARMDARKLPDTPGPPNKALMVPPTNPFANRPNVNTRLVYALGLRNPFRFNIDPQTGTLYISDVGWSTYEEINVAPTGGIDFGWPYFEGTQVYVTNECGPLPPPGLTPPAYQYNRTEYCEDCAAAAISGVLYRPVAGSDVSFPQGYDGDYFFSDYYEGFIWRIRKNGGVWERAFPEAGQPNATDWARGYDEVTDYVEGPDGAIYYARMAYGYQAGSGEIRRIIFTPGPEVTIDGRADSSYGAPVSVQALQTSFVDAAEGGVDFASGSELDQAYSRLTPRALCLVLAGNLQSNYKKLAIFFDTRLGEGQNRLRGDNPDIDGNSLNRMGDDGSGNGLRFDPDFAADYYLTVTGGDTGGGHYELFVKWAELLTNGGGIGRFLGRTGAASNGVLATGDNPFDIRVTIDNSNTAGVTAGTGESSGAGVTQGIELWIPLGALGSPTGTVRVAAFVNGSYGDFVSNQVLGGLPIGTPSLGDPRFVDFTAIPGLQYFWAHREDLVSAPPRVASEVALTVRVSPIPFATLARVLFTLPDRGPATIDAYDVAGHSVQHLLDGVLSAGPHDFVWRPRDASGRSLPTGVYFLRVEFAGRTETQKVVIVR